MTALFDYLDSPVITDESQIITGGFVDNTEPHLLKPQQAVRLLNAEPTVAGRRQKRRGVLCYGTGHESYAPHGLWEFFSAEHALKHFVGQWGRGFYSSAGDGDWTLRASSASLYNLPHMGVQGRASGVPHLFFSSCVPNASNESLPYSKLFLLDKAWGHTAHTATQARALAWFQGRLWAYNDCREGLGNSYLQWSAPLDGFDFSNGQNFEVDPDSGDVGTAIVPARDNTPRMFLFNEKSVYQLDIYWDTDGYYPTTANALDFTKSQLRPIVLGTGCIATRSAIWAPGLQGADVLFLSREGIRTLARSADDTQGGSPLPLSYRIQQTIDRINWSYADRAVAAYWDGRAYFAVPVDGSESNNFVIAYDVHRNAFHELDLRVGDWCEARLNTNRRYFFFQSTTCGTESGLGAASGATHGYHVYRFDHGTADPFGLPVQYTEDTRAFTCDSAGQEPGTNLGIRKKWNYAEFAVQSGQTGCTLTINYKVDDDQVWTTLGYLYIDPDTAAPFLPVQLPFGFGGGKMVYRSLGLRAVKPGYKIQVQIKDNQSYARFKVVNLVIYANPMNPRFRRD